MKRKLSNLKFNKIILWVVVTAMLAGYILTIPAVKENVLVATKFDTTGLADWLFTGGKILLFAYIGFSLFSISAILGGGLVVIGLIILLKKLLIL